MEKMKIKSITFVVLLLTGFVGNVFAMEDDWEMVGEEGIGTKTKLVRSHSFCSSSVEEDLVVEEDLKPPVTFLAKAAKTEFQTRSSFGHGHSDCHCLFNCNCDSDSGSSDDSDVGFVGKKIDPKGKLVESFVLYASSEEDQEEDEVEKEVCDEKEKWGEWKLTPSKFMTQSKFFSELLDRAIFSDRKFTRVGESKHERDKKRRDKKREEVFTEWKESSTRDSSQVKKSEKRKKQLRKAIKTKRGALLFRARASSGDDFRKKKMKIKQIKWQLCKLEDLERQSKTSPAEGLLDERFTFGKRTEHGSGASIGLWEPGISMVCEKEEKEWEEKNLRSEIRSLRFELKEEESRRRETKKALQRLTKKKEDSPPFAARYGEPDVEEVHFSGDDVIEGMPS